MFRKRNYLPILIFFAITLFVISGILFNNKLIGRSIDFAIPPIDFQVKKYLSMDFQTWLDTLNGGIRNTFSATLIPVNLILCAPLLFNAGSWLIGRYQIVLSLLAALISFYFLARKLLDKQELSEKNITLIAFMGSLLFALNNYLFCDIAFGSSVMYFTFSLIPAAIYFIISYFENKKSLYFILTLASVIIISSTLQHLVMVYLIFLILSYSYKNYSYILKIGLLHILCSLYWVLPFVYSAQDVARNEMAADYSAGLKISSPNFLGSLVNREYMFNRDLYNVSLGSHTLSMIWNINAFILLCISVLVIIKIKSLEKIQKKIIISFFLLLVLSLLFIKGGRDPFGDLVLFLYNKIPIFSLFRSLQHIIGFYVISISILFLYSLSFIAKKREKMLFLVLIFIIVNTMPWWLTRDLGTNNLSKSHKPSFLGQFNLSEGEKKVYDLNLLPTDFSLLVIPPAFSVYYEPSAYNSLRTQGGDMGLTYGNKKFFAVEQPSVFSKFLSDLEKNIYKNPDFLKDNANIFSILNVRYIVFRDNITPLFSPNSKLYDRDFVKEYMTNSPNLIFQKDSVLIAENKNFTPNIYIPQQYQLEDKSHLDLFNVIRNFSSSQSIGAYFLDQNSAKNTSAINLLQKNQDLNLEFKKINPTKYRVIIHNVKTAFPLIFSETFHGGWKVYLDKPVSPFKEGKASEDFTTSSPDQASRDEIADFVNKGIISSSNSSLSKFISKNYQGTIQNDNLDRGKLWSTWLKKPIIEEKDHLMVNGYANSWVVDPAKVCSNKEQCLTNENGSKDINLIIEYEPQKLFYWGVGLSVLVAIGIGLFFVIKKVKYS